MKERMTQPLGHRHRSEMPHGHLLKYGQKIGRSVLDHAIKYSAEVCPDFARTGFVLEVAVMCRCGLAEVSGHHAAASPVLKGIDDANARFDAGYSELVETRKNRVSEGTQGGDL